MQLSGGYSEIDVVVIWIVDLLNYCAASGKQWASAIVDTSLPPQ